MPTTTKNPSQVLEATESFVTMIGDKKIIVEQSLTRIAASHPLAQMHPTRFRPVEENLTYTDDATADAEPERSAKVTRRRAQNDITTEE
jgi:hypothetical protein